MIRIKRPSAPPEILGTKGAEQTHLDCIEYDTAPSDFVAGRAAFRDRRLYADRTVKLALVAAHFSKCCYCETKHTDPDNFDVEHFRPKGGVRQPHQLSDDLPGYYWMRYQWTNLLLSCNPCNRRYKKTFFPLRNPSERARSHHDELAREQPLLIDPAAEEPRDHVRFLDDAPIALTAKGQMTIDVLGLRRTSLGEDRRRRLQMVRTLYDLQRVTIVTDAEATRIREEARRLIAAATHPDAAFSSMVVDFLQDHPL
jgi:hypothetical protein